jgi:hypothetical protein
MDTIKELVKMSEFDYCVPDLDGKCAECKYADKSAYSEPCVECGFNYSRFEKKEVPTFTELKEKVKEMEQAADRLL